MKTNSTKTPAAEGNPAYPKLDQREAIVKAAKREESYVRKIPADDLKKTEGNAAAQATGKAGKMGRENPGD